MSRVRTAIAFAVSIAIHAFALGLRVPLPAVEHGAGTVSRLLAIETVPATRVVAIIPVPHDPVTESASVPERDVPAVVAPALAPSTVGPAAAAVTRRVPAMGAGAPDPRLWLLPASADPVVAASDPLARARDLVGARLDPYNDSLAAATEAERRAKEWTARDGAGGLWGITPDSIHLGTLAIPLRHCVPEPCPEDITYRGPPGRRDEYNERLRGFRAIEEQAARMTTGQAIDERVRAIRERNAKRDTTGAVHLP